MAQPTGQVALAPCQNATSFEPSTSSQFWVGTLGHSSSLRGEGSCNDQPQPCSSTPGHTFCATDPTPHQCQRPPRKGGCPKCPHTLPASSVIRDPHEMHLPPIGNVVNGLKKNGIVGSKDGKCLSL